MRYLIIILLFTACGQYDPNWKGFDYSGDPTFYPYVEQFVNMADEYGVLLKRRDCDIRYVANAEYLGQANHLRGQIYINKRLVDLVDDDERDAYIEYIVWHELGHLLLKRGHEEGDTFMTTHAQKVEDNTHLKVEMFYGQ